jgi:3-methyladenine DNA glycosylase AlkD
MPLSQQPETELLGHLRKKLRSVADPKKAPAMKAYMKSEMPYHGVPTPILRKLCKESFNDLEFTTYREWEKHILTLWRNAQFREERYAALHLASHRSSRPFQTLQSLKVYEEMVVTGAWWDYVDVIAAHHVGALLREFPKQMKPKMLKWSRSSNLWKRRTSILCQLGFNKETDLDLLYSCIEPSFGSKEFFLNKAIGWALRQYAWTDPKETVRYVKKNDSKLHPLSKREALKNL